MPREKNYWEGHPRAQAATDAILGGIGGSLLGIFVSAVVVGVSVFTMEKGEKRSVGAAFASLMLPMVGGITGAYLAGGRQRAGFSEAQRKQAGKGAAIGGIIPGVGAGAGTFFWTERSPNPAEVKRLRNELLK